MSTTSTYTVEFENVNGSIYKIIKKTQNEQRRLKARIETSRGIVRDSSSPAWKKAHALRILDNLERKVEEGERLLVAVIPPPEEVTPGVEDLRIAEMLSQE